MPIADTPEPPYTAVIFTSTRSTGDNGYARMLLRMESLAAEQPGYLGMESVKDGLAGITVSYWRHESDAAAWKQVAEHLVAQERGQAGLVRRVPGAGRHGLPRLRPGAR